MSAQLDLFAVAAQVRRTLPPIPHPYRHGQVALMWHGMHPLSGRTAWYWRDEREQIWRCIDPFDIHGINYRDTPPQVNDCGNLII